MLFANLELDMIWAMTRGLSMKSSACSMCFMLVSNSSSLLSERFVFVVVEGVVSLPVVDVSSSMATTLDILDSDDFQLEWHQ